MSHLIKVRKDKFTDKFVEVPAHYIEDDARRIAYRAVFRKREKDYNELVHATQSVSCHQIHVTNEVCSIFMGLQG